MSHIADTILTLSGDGDSFGGMYDVTLDVPPALSQHPALRERDTFLNRLSFRATNIRPPTINYSVTMVKYLTWSIPVIEAGYDVDKNSFSVTFRVDRQWLIYDFFLAWKGLVGSPELTQPSKLPLTSPALDPPQVTPSVIAPKVSLAALTGDLFAYPEAQGWLRPGDRGSRAPALTWSFTRVFPLKVEVNNDFNRTARQPMEMNVEFCYLFYSLERTGEHTPGGGEG